MSWFMRTKENWPKRSPSSRSSRRGEDLNLYSPEEIVQFLRWLRHSRPVTWPDIVEDPGRIREQLRAWREVMNQR